jgi:hypothetical protein
MNVGLIRGSSLYLKYEYVYSGRVSTCWWICLFRGESAELVIIWILSRKTIEHSLIFHMAADIHSHYPRRHLAQNPRNSNCDVYMKVNWSSPSHCRVHPASEGSCNKLFGKHFYSIEGRLSLYSADWGPVFPTPPLQMSFVLIWSARRGHRREFSKPSRESSLSSENKWIYRVVQRTWSLNKLNGF